MTKVAILGSGAWGTTLATLLAAKVIPVTLWEYHGERATAMQRDRENVSFLPGIKLPPFVSVTADLAGALDGADAVIFVTPAQRLRENVRLATSYLSPNMIIICGSKGIELGTKSRLSQILQQELPQIPASQFVALSGPNLAREIAEGKPAATIVAATDTATAQAAQQLLAAPTLRVYATDDVVGVEIGGAMKNVIAIAIGCSDGLGYGSNSRASLITRGLAEIVRLAVAQGGNPLTLAGLAGLGDLIATCSSALSRNYSLGLEITGSGRHPQEILGERHSVTEGVATARAALEMAGDAVELPITAALCRLFDGADARQLVAELLQRTARFERDH
ncbi:MAG TPA: NAD(P)H-dependent glycerol-3-phosphate dehydrogenase [Ktedonobacterales bacterium]|nr:NAD(P)H-dependent glycerol-3-phosphate dehydrogenase [Ktedonobacterales bacterium]